MAITTVNTLVILLWIIINHSNELCAISLYALLCGSVPHLYCHTNNMNTADYNNNDNNSNNVNSRDNV